MPRPFFELSYREARGHAIVAAVILWIAIVVMLLGGAGRQSILGTLKGEDFVHFYTLGRLALAGGGAQLYDADAQHALQASLVPESAGMYFLVLFPVAAVIFFQPSVVVVAWLFGFTRALGVSVETAAQGPPGSTALEDSATWVDRPAETRPSPCFAPNGRAIATRRFKSDFVSRRCQSGPGLPAHRPGSPADWN